MNAECQNTRELLDSFLSAELLVETNHQILRHLGGCESCRVELTKRQRVRALLKAALPAEEPAAELIERISSISGSGSGAPEGRVSRAGRWWSRVRRRRARGRHASRSITGNWFRQVAIATAGALLLVLLLGAAGWLPWAPNRLTASEVLAQSDRAASVIASRSDLVLHRSLRLEERRGRGGPVVARRRIEVWQSGASGVAIRRAFDEHNSLVAGEWRERNGMRTVYRAGSPPVRGATRLEANRLTTDDSGDNPAWRLDLSATEYAAAIPSISDVRVEEIGEHLVLKYETTGLVGTDAVLEATLTLRRDTLHPVGQTVVLQGQGDVREYSLTEDRFFTVPRDQVSATVFLPDAVFVPRIDPSLPPPVLPKAVPDPVVHPPAVAAVPSLEAELEVVYRLHRVNAWLRETPSVARTPTGALAVRATVDTAERRDQLLAALRTVTERGIAIHIDVDEQWSPPAPPVPPSDLHAMSTYRDLHGVFTEFIATRVPPSQRPPLDEQQRLIDGLVRSFAARNLDRSRGALDRAVQLERTVRQFSGRQPSQLSADAEATWHTILRDYARGIAHRLEAFRLEVQPALGVPSPLAETPAVHPDTPIDLTATSRELAQLLADIDRQVTQEFGAINADDLQGRFRDPAFWRAIAGAERLSALLQEPRPLGGR